MTKAFFAAAAIALATVLSPACAQDAQTNLPRVKLAAGMY
jgi:hypothetical protein